MNDYIILVDENDNEVGQAEKMEAHIKKLTSSCVFNFYFRLEHKKDAFTKAGI